MTYMRLNQPESLVHSEMMVRLEGNHFDESVFSD